MRLWLEVARRAFLRATAYRVATVSGVVVNTVFGLIRAAVLVHVARAGGGDSIRGMTDDQLATFAFVTQGFLTVTGTFGDRELGERVRSGDVAIDFYRPVDLQLWWSAMWGGKVGFLLLARGVPPVLLGSLFYDLVWPSPSMLPALLVAVVLASTIGFLLRFCSNLSTFWLLDTRGSDQLLSLAIMFFSGVMVPLNLFPGWLEAAVRWLPFAAMMQMPAEIYLGELSGGGLVGELARALGWVGVLMVGSRLILNRASLRVVVQGG